MSWKLSIQVSGRTERIGTFRYFAGAYSALHGENIDAIDKVIFERIKETRSSSEQDNEVSEVSEQIE